MRVVFSLLLLFLPTLARAEESAPPNDCSSIARILANAEVCDNRPVRVDGKISHIKRVTSKVGNPYTEFTLTDGPRKLTFFSYGHLSIDRGMCVRVEGRYHRERQVGNSIVKDQVVVEGSSDGVAKVPCQRQAGRMIGWAVALLVILALLVERTLARGRPYRRGRAFEEYAIGLFPEAEWEIEDRSSDTSKRIGRRVTGDVSYDFVVKHKPSARRYIVQCKYRSKYFRVGGQEGIEWAKPYQIGNYGVFQKAKGWPYLVCVGVGGRARRPRELFVFSLDRLRDPFLPKNEMVTARRDPQAPFTVDDDGRLGQVPKGPDPTRLPRR